MKFNRSGSDVMIVVFFLYPNAGKYLHVFRDNAIVHSLWDCGIFFERMPWYKGTGFCLGVWEDDTER